MEVNGQIQVVGIISRYKYSLLRYHAGHRDRDRGSRILYVKDYAVPGYNNKRYAVL